MGLRKFLVPHRRMGLISAVFVLLLSVTGLLLQHSNSLRLDQNYLGSSWLLGFYGFEVPELGASFSSGAALVSQLEDRLYFNERRISGSFADLVGLVSMPFGYLAATRQQLLLLTEDGQTIEILGSSHGIPVPLSGLGTLASGNPVLQRGTEVFTADLDSLEFPALGNPGPINWSESAPPSITLQEAIKSDYGASLISWERVLLDVHSGQFLGAFGRLIVDLMAILFILMAVTGIWIWSHRRR